MAHFPETAFDIIVKKVAPYVDDASKDTVEKLYAFLDLYGIVLGAPADEYLFGAYPTACFLRQDCLPNIALCFQAQPLVSCYAGKPFRGQVTARAVKEIKK